MKRTIFYIALIFSLFIFVGCGSKESNLSSEKNEAVWPENLIEIRTNIANSNIDFKINCSNDEAIQYTVLYNDKVYKTYTKTEKDWSILYDFSFKDVTKVTIRASDEANHEYEKSVLVVIEPNGFDFSNNNLEIYFASRYEISLKEIATLGDNLVSVDLEGQLISGDLLDLKDCQRLRHLSLRECTQVTGDIETLKTILDLNEL